jgi:hypothetical protein
MKLLAVIATLDGVLAGGSGHGDGMRVHLVLCPFFIVVTVRSLRCFL